MAKLACDLLCWHMRRMRQHFASICGAYGSKLLAHAAHTLAKSCKNEFLQAYAAHAVANCQHMRRMRYHFASVCGACGSNKLAQTEHKLENCQLCAAYGSTLLALTAHAVARTKGYTRRTCPYAVYAVANCQRRRRIRQQFASVHSACGSKTV